MKEHKGGVVEGGKLSMGGELSKKFPADEWGLNET